MYALCPCGPREITQFNNDITKFTSTGVSLWGGETIRNYVPPVVYGVALMRRLCQCSLRFPTPTLYQYKRCGCHRKWRNKLFPNLSTCLQRRAQLMASAVQPEDGIIAFAHELAGNVFFELIAVVTKQPIGKSIAIEELCLVGDDTVAHGLTDLYADIKCFGLDSCTSNIQLTYLSADGTMHYLTVNNIASPLAILACLIGGRHSKTDYPSYLFDMLAAGTQASNVMTKANGSEAIILNFIALMSLTGYGYFFIRISLNLYQTAQWVL
ncbi:hypothetical protein THRCLA_11886 [Thraustotheca clavata]|uniref:Uncharacterized protein n=1 Tax=Thraustotheca clavata TaxID=74557 RepID=A0A1V9Y5X1_9STRA|nr:hypothetical protein THRCLA_11886 [Thraustotheca clavata]